LPLVYVGDSRSPAAKILAIARMDELVEELPKSPMKRLGSTRKLLFYNSK